ncbi:hypothetical protein Cni_G02970 [Canna indica]|uniref:Uncharacterized protein n=1 Tax=Canna indica TaxID=4628 RepID=A0AAQ3Q111_9LILI|nr:hypothetical protein Cni_G02970 [Canna indica]
MAIPWLLLHPKNLSSFLYIYLQVQDQPQHISNSHQEKKKDKNLDHIKKPEKMSSNGNKAGAQGTKNAKAAASIENELRELITDETIQNSEDFDGFCHELYKIIEKLNKKRGSIQLTLPSKEALQTMYKEHHKEKGKGRMTKDEFRKILKDVITLENFSVGRGALDTILYIFGAPISCLLAKRVIPGASSISDDIFLPAITFLTVLVLAKTNKL